MTDSQSPQYRYSAPNIPAFSSASASLTPEQEEILRGMRNQTGFDAPSAQDIEAARRSFLNQNQSRAMGFGETAYGPGDGGQEFFDDFAKLPPQIRNEAEAYKRRNRNASGYEVLRGIGMSDEQIGVMQASLGVRKRPDPSAAERPAVMDRQRSLLAQFSPDYFAAIGRQTREKPEDIANQMTFDLAKYGISDLAQIGTMGMPGGYSVFFNKDTGEIIPTRFGSDMTGKGGKNFELTLSQEGVPIPVANWRDTSDKDSLKGVLTVAAVVGAPYLATTLAGAGLSGMASGAITGGVTGAALGAPDGLQSAVRGGLTGAAIGGAAGGLSDYANATGVFSPEGGATGSFMDPTQTWAGQTSALPATGTQAAGDSVYSLATGLGSAGPTAAGTASLNLPGGAGFNASLGSSNPNTFNADPVNLTTGVGTASGTPLGASPSGAAPDGGQGSQQDGSSTEPGGGVGDAAAGGAGAGGLLDDLSVRDIVGAGLVAAGAAGAADASGETEMPNLPGAEDFGSGVSQSDAIAGMQDVADRDRQIRDATAEQVAPYLADWLEAGRNASRTQADVADAQLSLANRQASDYETKFAPIQDEMARDAMAYGRAEDQEHQARKASQTVNEQTNAAVEAANQQLVDMGINPNSGRFLGANLGARIKGAATAAGAGNAARTESRDKGIALRANAAGFGLNLAQQAQTGRSSATDSLTKSANSPQSSIAGAVSTGEFAAGNPGTYMQPYQSAINADLATAGINASMFNAQAGRDAQEMAGYGDLIGTGLGLIFNNGGSR